MDNINVTDFNNMTELNKNETDQASLPPVIQVGILVIEHEFKGCGKDLSNNRLKIHIRGCK